LNSSSRLESQSEAIMQTKRAAYRDLQGHEWNLDALDPEERLLVTDFRRQEKRCKKAAAPPGQRWADFDNYWLPRVLQLYRERGLTGKQIARTPLYRIAQDLSSRLAVSLGLARLPDYRDHLRIIIATKFKTRRAFCKATGLSEDMLSHVLAGRKDLSLEALTHALQRIGYAIQLVPVQPAKTRSA
jgi:hypothetical protein